MKVEEVPVPVLLVTGTVGSGKSAVAAEINDALAALKVPNAAVEPRTGVSLRLEPGGPFARLVEDRVVPCPGESLTSRYCRRCVVCAG